MSVLYLNYKHCIFELRKAYSRVFISNNSINTINNHILVMIYDILFLNILENKLANQSQLQMVDNFLVLNYFKL